MESEFIVKFIAYGIGIGLVTTFPLVIAMTVFKLIKIIK